MKNTLDLKFIYIIGYAGHGKDTAKNILKENFTGNHFLNLSFADTMKKQVADILPSDLLREMKDGNTVDKLNELKDYHPDIEIFRGLNARRLLQILGTEFYRSELLDPNIHVRFSANKVLEVLGKSENPQVFVSSDTRFPNELSFLLQSSQFKKEDELNDFLKSFLKKSKKLTDKDGFVEHFKNTFKINKMNQMDEFLLERMWIDVENLKNVPEVDKSFDISIPQTANMKKEIAAGYGMLHMFRPIINPKKSFTRNMNVTDLMAQIKSYTQMTMDEVKSIRDNYKHYEVDFNLENIKKYGFLRADIRHYSEVAINDRKPEPFLSEPMGNPEVKDKMISDIVNLFENTINFKEKKENVTDLENKIKRKI